MESKYPRLVTHQQHALAVIRIFVGLWVLYGLVGRMTPGWVAGFQQQVLSLVALHPPGFYADFMRETMVPFSNMIASAIILADLAVGVCLVLGLFTAPACLLGAFMNLNSMFATMALGTVFIGIHLILAVVMLGLAFGYAGTTWGIDESLVGKLPWWCQGLLHYEYREF